MDDLGNTAQIHLVGLAVQQAVEAALDADHPHAVAKGGTHNGAHRSVHARRIAAAGKYANRLDFLCHKKAPLKRFITKKPTGSSWKNTAASQLWITTGLLYHRCNKNAKERCDQMFTNFVKPARRKLCEWLYQAFSHLNATFPSPKMRFSSHVKSSCSMLHRLRGASVSCFWSSK